MLGISGGIMTNNIVQSRDFFIKTNITPNYYLLPFNSHGYEMNPNRESVERNVSLLDLNKVIAIVPKLDEKEKDYLAKHNITKTLIGWL